MPDPVPPEMITLSRAVAAISSTRASGGLSEPNWISRSKSMILRANLRIDRQGPSSASGGKTMLTRLPSASRASTIGLLSSTCRPTELAMRWAMRTTCWASRKRIGTATMRPCCSTNTRSGPFTMMSVMLSSASSGSRGPRPSMSFTSSCASWRCSRALNWMRRSSAISASRRSTSVRNRSGDMVAAAAASRRLRHNPCSSAACVLSTGAGGGVGVKYEGRGRAGAGSAATALAGRTTGGGS